MTINQAHHLIKGDHLESSEGITGVVQGISDHAIYVRWDNSTEGWMRVDHFKNIKKRRNKKKAVA